MGAVEPLGFFEYTLTSDGTLSPDISYIGGIGIPMTLQCLGDQVYGCTDGGYGGWNSFQDRLKSYCPGSAEAFPNSDIMYCSPGQYGGVESLPYGIKWNIQQTFEEIGVTMSRPEPQSVAFCQPWSEATQCAQVNRGVNGCIGEQVCDGEALFYRDFDMRQVSNSEDVWLFNGYAAFVHTICGVYAGFAFPADDRGVGMRDGVPMKYASNKGAGCSSPVIELCPAPSSVYSEGGGYPYPPDAGAPAPAPAPSPASTGAPLPDTTQAPSPAPVLASTAAPTPEPVALTSLEIINETPHTSGGATIFDSNGGQSITVFGGTFCVAGAGGCTIEHGQGQSWKVDVVRDATPGIQWNLGRLAPDGNTCDNPCRQFQLNMQDCTMVLVDVSTGYCSTVPTPTWTPSWQSYIVGSKCVMMVSGGAVDHHADRCSCSWGHYPCDCPGTSCAGRCPSDDALASCSPWGTPSGQCECP